MSDRLEQLRALGLSEAVAQLASGRHPSDLFFFRCQAPGLPFPEGDARGWSESLIPLWQCGPWVTAVRGAEDGLEFVGTSAEEPGEVWLFARSEQGLLADLFSDLIEDEDWDDEEVTLAELREVAEAVGFRHLDALLEFQESHHEDPEYAQALARFTLGL